MTDNTSPVASLAAKLPKGNGLTRAVPKLFDSRGTLVPFVGLMRVEETGLDANDVQKLKGSIARFELAFGPSAADAKDLITRCATAATSVDGQMTFLVDDRNDEENRTALVRDLLEWGTEQTPPVDLIGITDLWNSWHGGHYDARLDCAPVMYLREFALTKGAIADELVSTVPEPGFNDGTDPDDEDDSDGDEAA